MKKCPQIIPAHDISAKKSTKKAENFQDILSMFKKITNQKEKQSKCPGNGENIPTNSKNSELQFLKPSFPKLNLQTVQKEKIKTTSSKLKNKAHPSLSSGKLNHHPPQNKPRGLRRPPTPQLPPEFKHKPIQSYFKTQLKDPDEPKEHNYPRTSPKLKVDVASSMLFVTN